MTEFASPLGKGVQFPPKIGSDGRWAWSSGDENVRESIRVILQTEPLERIMLPEFGGGLKSVLFQPNIPATHKLIEEAITRSLDQWEPRISVDSVDASVNPDDNRSALVTIHYTLVATDQSEQVQLRVLLGG